MPMQGTGQHAERVFLLPDPNGNNVKCRVTAQDIDDSLFSGLG